MMVAAAAKIIASSSRAFTLSDEAPSQVAPYKTISRFLMCSRKKLARMGDTIVMEAILVGSYNPASLKPKGHTTGACCSSSITELARNSGAADGFTKLKRRAWARRFFQSRICLVSFNQKSSNDTHELNRRARFSPCDRREPRPTMSAPSLFRRALTAQPASYSARCNRH